MADVRYTHFGVGPWQCLPCCFPSSPVTRHPIADTRPILRVHTRCSMDGIDLSQTDNILVERSTTVKLSRLLRTGSILLVLPVLISASCAAQEQPNPGPSGPANHLASPAARKVLAYLAGLPSRS